MWAGAPLVAHLGPNLIRSVHTASPRTVHRVSARFNAPKRWFALLVILDELAKRLYRSVPLGKYDTLNTFR